MRLSTFDTFKNLHAREGMVELDDEQLARLQKTLFDAVIDIDEACVAEGIEYLLCGGSVLGAVRHGGFIPWDDDIDLYMTRAAFERFEQVFDERLGAEYALLTPYRDERFILSVPQVRKRGTYVRLRDDFYLPDEDCGACIDIFVLDDAPDNAALRGLHGAVSLFLGLVASCRKFAAHRAWFAALAGDDHAMARTFAVKAAIGTLFAWRSENGWARTWDRWNARFRNASSHLLVDPTGRTHYFRSLEPRTDFLPAVRMPFADPADEASPAACHELPVPHDAAAYLTAHYGPDFMTPPADGHEEHHVVFGFGL